LGGWARPRGFVKASASLSQPATGRIYFVVEFEGMTSMRSRAGGRRAISDLLLAICAVCAVVACGLANLFAQGAPAVQSGNSATWAEATAPAPAADITSVGNVFWICGADEMIASSSDGGLTWMVHHQNPGGKILLHIAFVSDKVGHAAGKGGLLLSTVDGGKTWTAHNAGDDIWAFAFGDANNGIAVIGGDVDFHRFARLGDTETILEGPVKQTHDGGDNWEDIPQLRSPDIAPFTQVLAVAALDAKNYLMLRLQRNIDLVYVVTHNAGKSWKVVHQRNDQTDRKMTKWVFVHEGEYWAFGMELLHREKGGGYSAPLALFSADGELWIHGVPGPKTFDGCNPQGCYLWDGMVATFHGTSEYGTQVQYWSLPQDSSLSDIWAIAGSRACTIGETLRCATARLGPEPKLRDSVRAANHPGGNQNLTNLPFAKDCISCGVRKIPLDPGLKWQGKVILKFRLEPNGSVTDWSEDGAPQGPVGALVEEQFKHWKFAAPGSGAGSGDQRTLTVNVKCADVPEVRMMDGCVLTPGDSN